MRWHSHGWWGDVAGVFRQAVAPEARRHNGVASSRVTSLLTDALFGPIPPGAVTGPGKPLDAQVRALTPPARWCSVTAHLTCLPCARPSSDGMPG